MVTTTSTLSWSEKDELRRLREGDESAMGSIFDRWANRVKYYVLRQPATRSDDVAEEITQEAFIEFLNRTWWHERAYKKLYNVGAFLRKVATRFVIHEANRVKKEEALVEGLSAMPFVGPDEPEDVLLVKEKAQLVDRVLSQLPEEYQATARCKLSGCTPRETARLTEVTEWTARKRLKRIDELIVDALRVYSTGGKQ
jgi:RNA polymerase sigma factor (sigma-70 family)